jgi:hypothetical protein
MILKLTLGSHHYAIVKNKSKTIYYFDGKKCKKNKFILKEN